jgi:hypothetical protein
MSCGCKNRKGCNCCPNCTAPGCGCCPNCIGNNGTQNIRKELPSGSNTSIIKKDNVENYTIANVPRYRKLENCWGTADYQL